MTTHDAQTEDRYDELYAAIGARIKEARKTAKLTQDQLGELARLKRSSIANAEAGRQRIPIHVLLAIARGLGVEPGTLLLGNESISDLAEWLEVEAKRLRGIRWDQHGGTRNRYDLDHWADALQWAATKARTRSARKADPV